jgi:hypothetical protein
LFVCWYSFFPKFHNFFVSGLKFQVIDLKLK